MYRDFSDQSRKQLLGLVSQVESEKFSDFTDWIGDRWYDFESWIGKLNIKNYLNNVNQYHKKVIDKNNATESTINTIFQNVKDVDLNYKKVFSSRRRQLEKWKEYIDSLCEIVNPVNGLFNATLMAGKLTGIMEYLSLGEFNVNFEDCVEFDNNTQKYVYDWNKIEEFLSKPKDELSQNDYLVLVSVLSTMMKQNGEVDTDSLQHFVNLGYTTPSPVTSYDVHKSFYHTRLSNGRDVYTYYYYLQNKAYLNDTFLATVVLYDTLHQNGFDSSSNNLNDLLKVIVKDYSVIEWRMRLDLDHFDTKHDWDGKVFVKEGPLANFNEKCVPEIKLSRCNDENDKSMSLYYLIYSNAYDNGVETANTMPDGSITKDKIIHLDPIVRMYVDCAENQNTNTQVMNLKSKSELSSLYENYNIGENVFKEVVDFVVGLLPGGEYINGAISLSESTETLEQINETLNLIEKTDLEKLSEGGKRHISNKTEEVIDNGIDLIDKASGIYLDYKATELKNKRIDVCKKTVDDLHNDLSELTNLGVRYDTAIVNYAINNYDKDWNQYRDDKKNSEIISRIDFCNYSFDEDLLLSQYNQARRYDVDFHEVTKNDPEFLELKKQVLEYITTGELKGDYLVHYVEKW